MGCYVWLKEGVDYTYFFLYIKKKYIYIFNMISQKTRTFWMRCTEVHKCFILNQVLNKEGSNYFVRSLKISIMKPQYIAR